jgi:hypothetical protein
MESRRHQVFLFADPIATELHFPSVLFHNQDTTTSASSTYKIPQESAEDVLEDQVNITKGLTEAPNQSSEDINISDFGLTSKGKPRTYPTTLFILQSMSIYIISCIKSRS